MHIVVCLLSFFVFGQMPPPPPPPSPGMTVPPMTGTAAVRVRVVSEVTERPVKGASVFIIVESTAAVYTKSTITDAHGRAWLLGIAKGRVRISASHPGYISSVSGSAAPGDISFAWIPVADGQDVDVTLKMRRGSVIAGVVTDDEGAPVTGVQVLASRRDASMGTAKFARFAADETDDRGAYRLLSLHPGAYVVGIVPRYVEGRSDRPEFAVFDPDAIPLDGSTTAPPPALLSIDDTRGVLLNSSAPIPVWLSSDGTSRGYASVFYPNAPQAPGASVITLGPAETKSAIDLRTEAVALGRISGVISTVGADALGNIQIALNHADDLGITGEGRRWTTEPGERGEFGFSFVPAGRYVIEAVKPATPTSDPLAANVPVAIEAGAASIRVDVRLVSGPRFAGRVEVAADERAAAGNLRTYAVLVVPRNAATTLITPKRQTLGEDGQFDLGSIAPGEYTVLVNGGPSSAWQASSAMVDGQDVLDSSLKMTAGRDVTDAVLTLTSRRAQIVGRVRSADSAATSDGYVIVFPTDRTLWASTRRTLGVRPDTDGQYRVRSVPPGEYFVVSADGQNGQWRDVSFLDTLVARAERVTVKEGEIATRDVKRPGK